MRWKKNIYCDRCIRKSEWYERSADKAEREYRPMEDNCRNVVVTATFSRKRVLDDQTWQQQPTPLSSITSVPPGLSSSNSTTSAAGSSNSLNTPGRQSTQSSSITSISPELHSSNSTSSAAGSSNSSNTPGREEELDALKELCEGLTSKISVLEEKLLGSLMTRVTNLENITFRALTDKINDINRNIQGRVDVVEDRVALLENRLLQVSTDQEDADMGADWDAVEVPELATDGCVIQEDNHH